MVSELPSSVVRGMWDAAAPPAQVEASSERELQRVNQQIEAASWVRPRSFTAARNAPAGDSEG